MGDPFGDGLFRRDGTPDAEAVRAVLTMDDGTFLETVAPKAAVLTRREFGDDVFVSGLLAVSNYCINDCTYCGLRSTNSRVPRYRLQVDTVREVVDRFAGSGIGRVFFVSGEDAGNPRLREEIAAMTAYAKGKGLHVTLGPGEYSDEYMAAWRDAGADAYTLKFETSNRDIFRSIKPTTTFDARMDRIRAVKRLGMELGSGSIVGLTGQTVDDVVNDILLMWELGIDWAPVVPYLPAPGTPMAEITGMGNVGLALRVLAVLRLLMPGTLITAGQPSQGSKLGFADPEGNRAALNVGANLLFVDMTPQAVRGDFDITPGRVLPGVAHVRKLAESAGLNVR